MSAAQVPAGRELAAAPAKEAALCGDFVRAGAGATLQRGGKDIFLNGMNLAWITYGEDFGHAEAATARAREGPPSSYCEWEEALRFLRKSGGNAVRVWLDLERGLLWTHAAEDPRAAVAGLKDGFVADVQTLLELARHYDVYVVLVLFNGALVDTPSGCGLFSPDLAKRHALLTLAIAPLVEALKGHESLAMWEVINEPEGLLDTAQPPDGSLCTDVAPVLACATDASLAGARAAAAEVATLYTPHHHRHDTPR